MLTTNLRLIAARTAICGRWWRKGAFRADLYYALSVTRTGAAAAARRGRGDVAILAQQLLAEAVGHAMASRCRASTPAALEFLENYDWPGNLRELPNEVTRMLIFAQGGVLGAELISRAILQAPPGDAGADRSAEAVLTGDGTPEGPGGTDRDAHPARDPDAAPLEQEPGGGGTGA